MAFDAARLADPLTRDLMRRIVLVVDPAIDADFPGRRAAVVTIETKNGRREKILQPTRKGDPELPLTDEELEEKYRELAIPVIGGTHATAMLQHLWQLETKAGMAMYEDFAPGRASR
jgi:2-methylcitrate dehydratase PrpD